MRRFVVLAVAMVALLGSGGKIEPTFPLPVTFSQSPEGASVESPDGMERIVSAIMQCGVAYHFLRGEALMSQDKGAADGYTTKIGQVVTRIQGIYRLEPTNTQPVNTTMLKYAFRIRQHLEHVKTDPTQWTLVADKACAKYFGEPNAKTQ